MKPNNLSINNLYGILFMIVNAFALACLYTVNKQLLSGLPSSQATLLYKLLVFLFLAPWVLRKGLKGIKTPVMGLHIVRAFLSISGSLLFAYGLKNTNVVNATAIGYLEQVFWAIIGVFYFKEKMTTKKLLAIFTSFLAMISILFPETIENLIRGKGFSSKADGFDYHYIFVIIAAISWAINSTVIKVLGKSVKNEVQAFYVLLFSVLFAYPAAFFEWQWNPLFGVINYPSIVRIIGFDEIHLNNTQILQLFILALMYFIHVFSFFLALKYAEMSTVAPFDYTRLIFLCLLSYLLIGDLPRHGMQYLGYAMIIGSGVILVSAERKAKKKDLAQKLETEIENV
jgi:S-adenosylmethionine uptake transporter